MPAITLPNPIPRSILASPEHTLEIELLHKLAPWLPNDNVLIHHVPWSGSAGLTAATAAQAVELRRKQREDHSEIDLLLLDPQHGCLALEVKGGGAGAPWGGVHDAVGPRD